MNARRIIASTTLALALVAAPITVATPAFAGPSSTTTTTTPSNAGKRLVCQEVATKKWPWSKPTYTKKCYWM